MPPVAVSSEPTWAVPLTSGSELLLGAAPAGGGGATACTAAVGAEVAVVEPDALVAVTAARIVAPWSALVSR